MKDLFDDIEDVKRGKYYFRDRVKKAKNTTYNDIYSNWLKGNDEEEWKKIRDVVSKWCEYNGWPMPDHCIELQLFPFTWTDLHYERYKMAYFNHLRKTNGKPIVRRQTWNKRIKDLTNKDRLDLLYNIDYD